LYNLEIGLANSHGDKSMIAAGLPQDVIRVLDEVSAPEPNELDDFFGSTIQGMVNGGTNIVRSFR